jgi:hypothetical protein
MLILKIYLIENYTNFEIYQLKISKGGGAVLLLWANTFSPFSMKR